MSGPANLLSLPEELDNLAGLVQPSMGMPTALVAVLHARQAVLAWCRHDRKEVARRSKSIPVSAGASAMTRRMCGTGVYATKP